MKIRDFVELFDEIIERGNTPEGLAELANDPRGAQLVSEMLDQLEKYSDSSKEIVTSRLVEEDFVKFMLLLEKMAAATLFINGDDPIGTIMLMQAASRGTLQTYTHHVVMAVLGALVDEEIL